MFEMNTKIQQLRELRRMADELAAEICALEDSIKAYMTANGTDEIHGQSFKVTWKEVSSRRLDGKALKAAAPELWERFCTQTTIRRFVVA